MINEMQLTEKITEQRIEEAALKAENIFKSCGAANEAEAIRKPKQICIVVIRTAYLSDVFWVKIIDRIEQYIKLAGFSIVINIVEDESVAWIRLTDEFSGFMILGLINEKLVRFLDHYHVPIVLIDYKMTLVGYSQVRINNRVGAMRLAEQIEKYNHNNVLMIFAERGYAASYDERYDAYIEYFARHKSDTVILKYTVNHEKDVPAKMGDILRILNENPTISIIICQNDVVAIEIIKELKNNSFQIPQDISVVGFDNIEYAAMCTPPLTTINVPLNDLCQLAVELLIKKMKDIDSANILAVIEPTVIERETLADRREVPQI